MHHALQNADLAFDPEGLNDATGFYDGGNDLAERLDETTRQIRADLSAINPVRL